MWVSKGQKLYPRQPFVIQNQEAFRPALQNLDYDLYRRIRFLPERSVWARFHLIILDFFIQVTTFKTTSPIYRD